MLALSDPAVRFRVLSVPGHTRDHLAFYMEGILFCGDTLFSAGCGRLLGGSAAEMTASLGLLAALPDETKVYAAHEYTRENLRFALLLEPENVLLRRMAEEAGRHHLTTLPSTIGQEKAINPFLRCSEPAVLQAAQRRDVRARDPVSVFAVLRAWKDEF
jgi:hydroxyacylglutathione hydrolase